MNRSAAFSIFLFLSCVPAARPDDPAPQELPEGLSAVLEPFDARMANAARIYQGRLDTIYAQYRKEGELDAILVIREERARFDAGGLPSASDRVAYPPELAALQDAVLKQYDKFHSERSAALAAAGRKRIEELLQHQRELTRQDRIEEAVAVRASIQALKEHPVLGPLLAEEPPPADPGPAPEPAAPPPVPAPPPSPPAPPPPVLTAWDFEGPEGKPHLPSTGQAAWVVSGAVSVAGRTGNGLLLGRNFEDAVLADALWKSLADKDSFTLGAWVRLAGPDLAGGVFSRQTEKQRGWVLRTTATGLARLEVAGAAGEKLVLETAKPLPDGWNHLAFSLESTANGTRAALYVNGDEVNTASAAWAMAPLSLPVRLGRYYWSPSFDLRLNGLVDTVTLGVPALDPAQVKDLAR